MPTPRPRIGLLGLMLELYDKSNPELRPAQEAWLDEVAQLLAADAEVVRTGICNTRAAVAGAVDRFLAEGVELVVTVHPSYAPSLIALPELLRWNGPLVLWNTQRITAVDGAFGSLELLQNHGMHGVQDLANTLLRARAPFAVVTGHWQDEVARREIVEWGLAARTAKALRGLRVGQIGHAFQDMGDFGIDETALLAQLGPHVVRVPLDELAAALRTAPRDELEALVAGDRAAYEVDAALTHDEHLESARVEWAVRRVVGEMGLGAVSAHYEPLGKDPRFGALPFAAMGKLLGEGMGFGGEGDVTSASLVAAMQLLCGPASFTEMFTMDFEGGSVYIAHYAEANPVLARADRPIRMVRREGWVGSGGVSTSLAFGLAAGPATLANLTVGPNQRLRLIVAEGELLDFVLPDPQTPHGKLRPMGDLSRFVNAYAMAGGSHHLGLVKGHRAGMLRKLAELAGLECIVIGGL